ncbi:MAG: 50S ribosomal protein L21 [Candidatus Liptonbacteria bacterium]|nr:50S ribosomal protein L21 [Candidatus Liptonbacteria bacterium]
MANFSVIATGGKQYKVASGEKVRIEKIEAEVGGTVKFDKVLLKVNGDTVEVGMPHIAGAVVEAKVLDQGRERKKLIFKYHSKTRYRKRRGHRQMFTEVEIV